MDLFYIVLTLVLVGVTLALIPLFGKL